MRGGAQATAEPKRRPFARESVERTRARRPARPRRSRTRQPRRNRLSACELHHPSYGSATNARLRQVLSTTRSSPPRSRPPLVSERPPRAPKTDMTCGCVIVRSRRNGAATYGCQRHCGRRRLRRSPTLEASARELRRGVSGLLGTLDRAPRLIDGAIVLSAHVPGAEPAMRAIASEAPASAATRLRSSAPTATSACSTALSHFFA